MKLVQQHFFILFCSRLFADSLLHLCLHLSAVFLPATVIWSPNLLPVYFHVLQSLRFFLFDLNHTSDHNGVSLLQASQPLFHSHPSLPPVFSEFTLITVVSVLFPNLSFSYLMARAFPPPPLRSAAIMPEVCLFQVHPLLFSYPLFHILLVPITFLGILL